MFDRPRSGERAILVHLKFPQEKNREELDEFRELVSSAGATPIAVVKGSRNSPHPRYFVGSGKAEEIRDAVEEHKAEVVLFNHELSPSQERNLEELLKCRVLDRTGVILDIFAQRAQSHEGKLQVELAQLRHLSTRLVRGWTHLERQKGGIGLRGPGETQLETDRRLLAARIKTIKKRLKKVQGQRQQGRRNRKRQEAITVSLVGYTNAGKSTLFNRISGAGVLVEDKLFATLDPTMRRVDVGRGEHIVLADTVGFIRHLPHDLVTAFHSTLEETREADLLLHVVDASSERRDENIDSVNIVLDKIEADEVTQIIVYNKIDMLPDTPARVDRDEDGKVWRIWVSAMTGAGIDDLRKILHEVCYAEVDKYQPVYDLEMEQYDPHDNRNMAD
ncbi:MAG: GTPase HflX [Sulfuriflexus sp.]|nr:GTPase HflX [Sulfuriflexus sp.]